MREKIIEYNGNEYKIKLEKDRLGIATLKIYKKTKLLFIPIWEAFVSIWWDYHHATNPDLNPIDYAMEANKEKEERQVKIENYEKKLDEWFK